MLNITKQLGGGGREGVISTPLYETCSSNIKATAVRRKQWPLTVDSAMCSVSPPPHLGCPVDLHMIHYQSISVQHLHLCVALCILEQMQKDICTFEGPATLGARHLPVLGLHNTTGRGRRNDGTIRYIVTPKPPVPAPSCQLHH